MSSPAVFIHSLGMTVLILTLYFLVLHFLYLCNLSKISANLLRSALGERPFTSHEGAPPRLRVQRYANFPNWPNLFTIFFNLFSFFSLFAAFWAEKGLSIGQKWTRKAPVNAHRRLRHAASQRGARRQEYLINIYTRAREGIENGKKILPLVYSSL